MNEQARLLISHDAVDWEAATRVVVEVEQTYFYRYPSPVRGLEQRLVMVPPDCHGDQRLLSSHIEVQGATPPAEQDWSQDAFGNRRCHVSAEGVDDAISFTARYEVERSTSPAASSSPFLHQLNDYLRPTALTAADAPLRRASVEVGRGASSLREVAERVQDWTAGAIGYQLGVTGVHTPAAMAYHLGRGVCQDYAHLMLTMLRLLDVPARYVSGHLLGEGAPHAWVEALIPVPGAQGGVAVLPYDPTHHRTPGLNYVTVAVGRDFADVTPTSGTFRGPSPGCFEATKEARLLGVEYRDRGNGQ